MLGLIILTSASVTYIHCVARDRFPLPIYAKSLFNMLYLLSIVHKSSCYFDVVEFFGIVVHLCSTEPKFSPV